MSIKKFKENITKNQHIVPQRHLKNFIILGGRKLESFNIDELRIAKSQSPKSICKGYFHYAMEPGEEDKYSQIVEKAFGNIETWYGNNIDRIEKLLLLKQKLKDEDRYGISWVIANFLFRGCRFRREIKKTLNQFTGELCPTVSEHIHKGCIKEYSSIFCGSDDEKLLVQKITKQLLSSEADNTSHATNSAFDEGHANTLTHKYWRVLINHSNTHPFITSDEAVIEVHNNNFPKNLFLSESFLLRTQIFHLSPKIAIIALFPFNEETHGKTEFLDITNREPAIAGNNLQYVNHANKYAYAPNKIFFEGVIDFNKNKAENYSKKEFAAVKYFSGPKLLEKFSATSYT